MDQGAPSVGREKLKLFGSRRVLVTAIQNVGKEEA